MMIRTRSSIHKSPAKSAMRPVLQLPIEQAKKKSVEFNFSDCEDKDPESLRLRQKRGRLAQPRMSLLGKPLYYRARRDARYRRSQNSVYNFLERPGGYSFLYHAVVFLTIFASLVISVFATIETYEETAGIMLMYMEILSVVWFGIEFVIRIWSAGCRSRYQGLMGRLRFMKRPFSLIDLFTLGASIYVVLFMPLQAQQSGQGVTTTALRGLRFFHIVRMVRMDRRAGTWKLLGSVVYAHRQELITTLYIGFLGLIFASFMVFLVERDVNKKFTNFAQALWWGVITLCTVGYGDTVPETWQGKIIASFCALLGISFFALPAGILGSGFALKVQQQQRQKHLIRRRQPAAMLIQSLWRCYAADEQSLSVATWKIHQVPYRRPQTRVSSSFRHNASFVRRLPTIRRLKTSTSSFHHSTSLYQGLQRGGRTFATFNQFNENLAGVSNNETRNCEDDTITETILTKKSSDDEDEPPAAPHTELTRQHKGAIRAIRKIKFFVARKKFREALRPYDVKDVIEQYSTGHADLLSRVKNVHFRLDQILGKQDSKAKDVYASKICLAARVVKVERQVDDVETKIDQLLELYMEDRKLFLSLPCIQATIDKTPSTIYTSSAPPSSSVFKPKSILVDKHSSEPSSPISKSVEESPSGSERVTPRMRRGFTDLGKRIKKRVKLRTPYDAEMVIVVPTLNPPTTSSASGGISMGEMQQIEEQELRNLNSTDSSESEDYNIKGVDDDYSADTEEQETEMTETTLLCPSKPSEILITPTTLGRTTVDVYSENIGLVHLQPERRNIIEDV